MVVVAVVGVAARHLQLRNAEVVATVTQRRGELDLRLEIFGSCRRRLTAAERAASLSSPIVARAAAGVRPPRGDGFGGGCGMPGSAAAETSPSGTQSVA